MKQKEELLKTTDETEQKPFSPKKELLCLLCLFLALILFCGAALRFLTPKRHDYGAVWDMYLQEPENTVDALFFGSSLVYCDVIPAEIYRETGTASFVMAGPEQTFPVTYWYLREACKTQSPKTVFIEATGLLYGKVNRSVKVNLTYMPWSMNRLAPTFQESLAESGDSLEEREIRTGLLFPLYAYHDRWDDLEEEDLREGIFGSQPDPLAGYTFLDKVMEMEGLEEWPYHLKEESYGRSLKYAEKMVEFCREKGIRPVFFLTPRAAQPSEELQERLEADLTGLGADFWNCGKEMDAMGLDFSLDFFDELHFNYRGAEKFSRYLGEKLPEWGVSPGGNQDGELWKLREEHFSGLRDEADAKPVSYNQSKE